ncbi:YafY family transcriptional regulator [Siculibacillus lacustris]|uniref:YafY family transcriptional regulator n=1 Tax=Siculibacillus lacustris TaxID=1549641 RepID=A0A4Q9VKJ2_9HYPH|nr:YafY family protein [Siculibacillus lacustris]TBW35933.1 YafY family transcriptional regulator [Siculibacillus lacustris]
MSRSARLLDLVQILRRHRRPVTAAALAAELGISPRSLYRDVATLRGQGAPIDGEAGLGYVLRPGFTLPPLMFGDEELEALALGARFVAEHGDPRLAAAARDALARIAAVLPDGRGDPRDADALLVGPGKGRAAETVDPQVLRDAIRAETRLALTYRDAAGRESRRIVWPMALAFFERVRILVAWCETRAAFRHFRLDRMIAATPTGERYPRRRRTLMRDWRRAEGITGPGAADEN